jgi:hypothetical protein
MPLRPTQESRIPMALEAVCSCLFGRSQTDETKRYPHKRLSWH